MDSSDNAKIYLCAVVITLASGTEEAMLILDGGNFVGGTNPVTDEYPWETTTKLGAGDTVAITYEYEAA